MSNLKITWPVAAVIVAGVAAVACVLLFAPMHVTEALSAAIGLAVGAGLPQLITRKSE